MLNHRDEKKMINLILQIANDDERIRAVIVNGSRTISSAKKDIFQDYDIVYLVAEVESFVHDQNWINRFGEILIMQEPDKMDGKWPESKDECTYLMLFKDWNRIDLTLLHLNRLSTMPRDSQSILLLDKDYVVKPFESSDLC
jgi:aminoglycoside 6-adenylyltransferase